MKILQTIIITLVCLFYIQTPVCAQQTQATQTFGIVRTYDPDSELEGIEISTPSFYSLSTGKRIRIKISNTRSNNIRWLKLNIYYSNNGYNKRLCKINIPKLKKNESHEFGINISAKYANIDKKDLTFTLRKKEGYKSYQIREE